jgi:glyoxylate reductase
LNAKVIVPAGIPEEWLEALVCAGYVLEPPVADCWAHEDLVKQASEADALLTTLGERVDAAVLEAGAGRLRVVANIAVGYDNIDVRRATSLGIAVCNTPGVLDDATADLTMLLVLNACRLGNGAEQELRRGAWPGWQLTGFLGKDLTGAVMGLVGYGQIAQAVERRAAGFGMEVRHNARRPTGKPGYVADLDTLLAQADIVSLHVPLTEQTRGLLDARRIALMKKGSVLVNTARGAVVDEEALVDALESGHLWAAGLDVYSSEPEVPARLLQAPRTVLLPHIGSATHGTRKRMTEMACRAIVDVLQGRRPQNVVPPG